MNARRVLAILAFPGALLAGPTVNLKFNTKTASIQRVCLLPVNATLTKIGMKGAIGMTKEAQEWAASLDRMITNAFGDAGAASVIDLSLERISDHEQEKRAVAQIQQRYTSIFAQLRMNPDDVRHGRYTLGDEVALLPCSETADALVFVDAAGTLETKGRRAFGLVVAGFGSLLWTLSDVSLSLVDTRTGEVIGYSRLISAVRDFTADSHDTYEKRLTKDLHKMHVGPVPVK